MQKQTFIILITLIAVVLVAFLLVKNETKIIGLLPIAEDTKLILEQSGVYIWVVIAPAVYLCAVVGLYVPRIKRLKTELENNKESI
jgi:type III secretory pathway component EscS